MGYNNMDKITMRSLLLIFFLFSSYLDAQGITRIIIHSNEALAKTADQSEENILVVLSNSLAFKDPGNDILGFQQVGDYKYLIDISDLDDAKRAYMDDQNISDKNILYVVKDNIGNDVTFSNGEIIIFSKNTDDVYDFINEFSNSLFLVSSFDTYSVIKIRNINQINYFYDLLLRDIRFEGIQLNMINPYISAN
tara:strand:+ start:435 stop:1016 length:582 start_codon:yes stop_codon:yes gene_type:complete